MPRSRLPRLSLGLGYRAPAHGSTPVTNAPSLEVIKACAQVDHR